MIGGSWGISRARGCLAWPRGRRCRRVYPRAVPLHAQPRPAASLKLPGRHSRWWSLRWPTVITGKTRPTRLPGSVIGENLIGPTNQRPMILQRSLEEEQPRWSLKTTIRKRTARGTCLPGRKTAGARLTPFLGEGPARLEWLDVQATPGRCLAQATGARRMVRSRSGAVRSGSDKYTSWWGPFTLRPCSRA